MNTSVRAGSAALPQGPSLRSGLFCPGPSSLNWPHPPHSRAHPDFTAWRLIPDAFAVHICICLGNPRLVLSFHCWSFATCRPLSPRGTFRLPIPSTSPKTLAFNSSQKFRHSRYPLTPMLVREIVFEALLRFACATTCCLACPPCRSRPDSHPAHEDVYFRASDGLVTHSIAGYHYSANWEPCAGGTSTRWIIN